MQGSNLYFYDPGDAELYRQAYVSSRAWRIFGAFLVLACDAVAVWMIASLVRAVER